MSGSMSFEAQHAAADAGETARLGMWIFLATEVLFFGGLLMAYLYGRTHWPGGFGEASRHTDVMLGTVNTGLLLPAAHWWRWRSPAWSSSRAAAGRPGCWAPVHSWASPS
jgi:cytochrome c oxidase subunit 3